MINLTKDDLWIDAEDGIQIIIDNETREVSHIMRNRANLEKPVLLKGNPKVINDIY